MIRKQEIKKLVDVIINMLLTFFSILLAFTASYFLFFKLEKTNYIFNIQELNFFGLSKQIILVFFLLGALFVESGLFTNYRLTFLEKFLIICRNILVGTIIFVIINFIYPDFLFSNYFIIFCAIATVIFVFLATLLAGSIRTFYKSKIVLQKKLLLIGLNKVSKYIKRKNQQNKTTKTYFYPLENTDVKNLKQFLISKKITDVIITNPNLTNQNLLEISDICDELNINIKFSPTLLELRMGEITFDDEFGIPLLQIKPVSFLDRNFINKRIFDVLFAIFVLSLSFFVMLFIALLIKITSKGQIFYKQKRVGLKGRIFDFYKFRTMIPNADKFLDKLQHFNERQGPVFKMRKDPRLTYVGKFLRKFSIDEFPQFYNVLRGDMSIVGPRPPLPKEVEFFDTLAKKRFKIFPGITGIWQISGRSDLSFDEMIALDIYYLEHWTFAMDLEIILKTIPAVLTSRGAC